MLSHQFQTLGNGADRAEICRLLQMYLEWAGPAFAEENGIAIDLDEVINGALSKVDQFQPPEGIALLGSNESGHGIGFVQRIRPEVGEIKRLFVETGTRGTGLGRAILRRLCDEARDLGMRQLYLDTAGFMQAAHGLYRAEGFQDCEAYPEAEHNPEDTPTVLFMRKELT